MLDTESDNRLMHEPFTGVLLLPSSSAFGTTTEVTLTDGTLVAVIHRQTWTMRAKFEIFAADDTTLLATGQARGFWGNSYEVLGPQSEFILEYAFSGWSGPKKGTVTLSNGRELTTEGNWSQRDFTVSDTSGTPVAGLVTTSSAWTLRGDSLAFEIHTPVLTMLQAISLAQTVRTAVDASRQAAT